MCYITTNETYIFGFSNVRRIILKSVGISGVFKVCGYNHIVIWVHELDTLRSRHVTIDIGPNWRSNNRVEVYLVDKHGVCHQWINRYMFRTPKLKWINREKNVKSWKSLLFVPMVIYLVLFPRYQLPQIGHVKKMPINKHCILVLPRARSNMVVFCLLRKNKIKHNICHHY